MPRILSATNLSICGWSGAVFAGLVWLGLAMPVEAGNYRDSSHGQNVNRGAIDNKYNQYATGNCGHCHEAHASLAGVEPQPLGGAASKSLGFAAEQNLCLACHDGAPAGTNISSQFSKTYPHGKDKTGTSYMTVYDNRHLARESASSAFEAANRHAECVDCHNPHQATAANPLKGATGLTPVNGAAWTLPTYSGLAEVSDPAQQYKICFKCHSNWAGHGTGTNQAREFNSANRGFHNIYGVADPPSSNTYGNFNASYVFKMMPRYQGYTNAQLRNVAMRCSDCHGDTDASPKGVHGSAVKTILKVPAGSSYNKWDTTLNLTAAGKANAWCFNCHDPSFTNSGFSNGANNYHNIKHNSTSGKCMSCHVRVPHGWQAMPRLLKPQNAVSGTLHPAWNTVDVADRPKYNGTGTNSGVGTSLSSWPASGAWTEGSASSQASMSHQACN